MKDCTKIYPTNILWERRIYTRAFLCDLIFSSSFVFSFHENAYRTIIKTEEKHKNRPSNCNFWHVGISVLFEGGCD